MTTKKQIILLLVLVALLFALQALFKVKIGVPGKVKAPSAPEQSTQTDTSITARFLCKNGAFIDAKFFNQDPRHVEISLSDERAFSLPQAMSASGARYANADESIVFWNKGDTAFIEEGGKTTLIDCAIK